MTPDPVRVLLVEDNPRDARFIELLLAQSELPIFSCHTTFRLENALAELETKTNDVVLLDLGLPDASGLEALKQVRRISPEIPVVVLTVLDDDATALEALQNGAQDYLVKGSFEETLVCRTLQYAMERSRAIKVLSQVNQDLMKEMTERKQLEKAILEVREEEQERVGRDLHDDLGQQLTGIAFVTKLLANQLNKKSLSESKEAEAMLLKVNNAIDTTRRISKGLYPMELETNGLMFALNNLVSRIQEASGIDCSFRDKSRKFAPRIDISQHLYRIVQEALNNAVKHGRPRKILVDVTTDRDETTFLIKDDGIGFSADSGPKKGMGLQIMKLRAKVVGADLDIQSKPKGGTTICVKLGWLLENSGAPGI